MELHCAVSGCSEEAKCICLGYSLCAGCYFAWTELPKDLIPRFTEVLTELGELLTLESEEEMDYLTLAQKAIGSVLTNRREG